MSRWRRFMRWSGFGCVDCGRTRLKYQALCGPCMSAAYEAIAREIYGNPSPDTYTGGTE